LLAKTPSNHGETSGGTCTRTPSGPPPAPLTTLPAPPRMLTRSESTNSPDPSPARTHHPSSTSSPYSPKTTPHRAQDAPAPATTTPASSPHRNRSAHSA